MNNLLFLIGGFTLLFFSGKYLVRGSVELANHFKISKLVIGLTVVSFGTSAPELIVSLKAAIAGHPDISIGNIVGSNISNIALVLGITALIYPIPVVKKLMRVDWPIMMLATIMFYVFILNRSIDFWEGIIFILLLIAFNYFSVKNSSNGGEEYAKAAFPWYLSLLIIVASSIGLVFGADFLVKGASSIARDLGVDERIISVSVIAFGTSVPELATSVLAALKKETDISIGNIIGSNIFNLWGILGVTAIFKPIPVNEKTISFDAYWLIGISLLLVIFMFSGKKNKRLSRFEGAFLVIFYICYIFFVIS